MTWVDLVVLGVLAVSGLLAFMRGFVREVLGLGAWIGAAAFTWWGLPHAKPFFAQWITAPDWVGVATGIALFLGSLLVLMLISSWIGKLVRASVLGGLDRTLGLVFGLARGAMLVVFAYIAAGMVIPPDQWPEAVKNARALPVVIKGADLAVAELPPNARPKLPPPPVTKEASASDLLHAPPQGRAVGSPPRTPPRN
jgi:membrane protein required for colicin V production